MLDLESTSQVALFILLSNTIERSWVKPNSSTFCLSLFNTIIILLSK